MDRAVRFCEPGSMLWTQRTWSNGWPRNLAVGPVRFFGKSAKSHAGVCKHRMDLVWHGLDKRIERAHGGSHVGTFEPWNKGELGRAVDGDESGKRAFRSAHLGDVPIEQAIGWLLNSATARAKSHAPPRAGG